MKSCIIYVIIFCSLYAICSSKKIHAKITDQNNIQGLPTTTQIGANTFGCLVNGVPWVTAASNSTPNLNIDYNSKISNEIFTI